VRQLCSVTCDTRCTPLQHPLPHCILTSTTQLRHVAPHNSVDCAGAIDLTPAQSRLISKHRWHCSPFSRGSSTLCVVDLLCIFTCPVNQVPDATGQLPLGDCQIASDCCVGHDICGRYAAHVLAATKATFLIACETQLTVSIVYYQTIKQLMC
jgi:hypothetical protein